MLDYNIVVGRLYSSSYLTVVYFGNVATFPNIFKHSQTLRNIANVVPCLCAFHFYEFFQNEKGKLGLPPHHPTLDFFLIFFDFFCQSRLVCTVQKWLFRKVSHVSLLLFYFLVTAFMFFFAIYPTLLTCETLSLASFNIVLGRILLSP